LQADAGWLAACPDLRDPAKIIPQLHRFTQSFFSLALGPGWSAFCGSNY
jgi:hypothetical protein